MNYGYMIKFANSEDLKYYMTQDPAHLTFKKNTVALMEKFKQLDFVEVKNWKGHKD